jgi:hypothetical protein
LSRIPGWNNQPRFRMSAAQRRERAVLVVKGAIPVEKGKDTPDLFKHAKYLETQTGGKPIYFRRHGILWRPGDTKADIERQINRCALDIQLVRGIQDLKTAKLEKLLDKIDQLAHEKNAVLKPFSRIRGWFLKRAIRKETSKLHRRIRAMRKSISRTWRSAHRVTKLHALRSAQERSL